MLILMMAHQLFSECLCMLSEACKSAAEWDPQAAQRFLDSPAAEQLWVGEGDDLYTVEHAAAAA